jgi:membrane protease YdiL (CAAX protease family)
MNDDPNVGSAPAGASSFDQSRLGLRIVWWEVLAVAFITIALFLLIGVVLGAAMGALDPNRAKAVTTSLWFILPTLGLSTLGMIGAVYVICVWRRRIGWREFGLKPVRPRVIGLAFVIGLVCVPGMGLIGAATQSLLGKPIGSPQLSMVAPGGFSWAALVGMIAIGGLLAPFAEEMIFRGLLYRWLRGHWPVWAAAVTSALLFGLVHGIPAVIPAAAAVGVVLAITYEQTGSLWPSVVIHATQNTTALALMFASLK